MGDPASRDPVVLGRPNNFLVAHRRRTCFAAWDWANVVKPMIKRRAGVIPLCHPPLLTHIEVRAKFVKNGVAISSTVRTTGPTGVEMEALTAASVAALTVYDMCKALDKGMRITDLRLLEKSGGKSGTFRAPRRTP